MREKGGAERGGTEREQTLFNHGNLFNTNRFSDEERKIEGGRVLGIVREGTRTGREGGEKVSSGFLVLSYGSFGHPNPPVSLPEVRGQVRWSTCGSQASI